MKQRDKIYIGMLLMGSLSVSLFGACANELNMGGKKVTNVGTPTDDQDAATKKYVDRGGAALSGSTITHNGLTYGVIYAGGKAWLDRNLGATQVATSTDDKDAYGDLYQWGRLADGHQTTVRNQGSLPDGSSDGKVTTTTLAGDNDPGTSAFIITSGGSENWRVSDIQFFWSWSTRSGGTGVCPVGWRVPSEQDFRDLGIANGVDVFSKIRLTFAGSRQHHDATLNDVGREGRYWTATVDGSRTRYFNVNESGSSINSHFRASGFSVRCMKNL